MKETFTRKIGPLPMWAWTAIIGAVIVGWAWYKNRNSAQSSPAGADASQVPQFVNQTYTTVQPPSAPPLTGPIESFGGRPPDQDDDNDTTPPTATSPGGHPVSRVHRSPKVKHQINQIHREHQEWEKHRHTEPPAKAPTRTKVHHGPKRVPPHG